MTSSSRTSRFPTILKTPRTSIQLSNPSLTEYHSYLHFIPQRPDNDDMSSNGGFVVAESLNDKTQRDDNSYYINFADDRSMGGNPNFHNSEKNNQFNYFGIEGGGRSSGHESPEPHHQMGTYHGVEINENDEEEDDPEEAAEIEGIFANTQQQTSMFPNQYKTTSGYQHTGNEQMLSNGSQVQEEEQRARQQKIKEMLKEFSKKKDQVIKEQIKQRVASGNQYQQPQQSSKNSTSKQIFFVDQHHQHTHRSKDNNHNLQHPQQSQNPLLTFTVDDNLSRTKYQVQGYKKACSTCKSMKQEIQFRIPKDKKQAIQSEPAFVDVKKLKQKLNLTDIGTTNNNNNNNNNGGGNTIINHHHHHHLSSNSQIIQPKTPRYAHTHRTQELRDYSYDDLIRLIEQLERENAELRALLDEANLKLSRMEGRDDLILQYQNELQLAKQRLNMNTQHLKDTQNIYKMLIGIINDLQKYLKTLNLDKLGKQKLTELGNRMKQLVGGQDQLDRFESLIQENNLSSLMQDCLQTKVKNLHQREILNMEKDFHQNLERMRLQLQDQIKEDFKRDLERCKEDIEDKQDIIDEMRGAKNHLKNELELNEIKMHEMEKQIALLEDERSQLEEIVKEADQALLLKEQYGLLQQEYEDQQERFKGKLGELEGQLKDMEQKKKELIQNQGKENQALKDEIEALKKERDTLKETVKNLLAQIADLNEKLKLLDQIDTLKEQLQEVERQRQSIMEREKIYEQKERNRKLLQEQLDEVEERNRLLEKAKKKLEIDLAMQKQAKEKLIEQSNKQDDEIKKARNEVNEIIKEKCEIESQLQNKSNLLNKVEGSLKDKKEFQKLEDLVQQIQSTIMFKSQAHFNDNEKQLIRELFGMKPGESDEVTEKLNEMREDNNKLYFELRNEYDHGANALKKQKEYLKQLQDFARAILTIEDKIIEKNLPFTLQKRNKAPVYSNVESIIAEIQGKIEDIEQKQKALDRLSIVKGLDKYDDAFKGAPQSRKGSVKSAAGGGKFQGGGGAAGFASPSPIRKIGKKDMINQLSHNRGAGGQEQFNDTNQSLYATLQPPGSGTNLNVIQQNDPQKLSIAGKNNTLPVTGGHHKKKKSTLSDMGHNFLKEAVDDPQFIEELMGGINDNLSRGEYTQNYPNIHVDRATHDSENFNNPNQNDSGNQRLQRRQNRLKHQINDVLGMRGGNRSVKSFSRQRSSNIQRQLGSQANNDGFQSRNNKLLGPNNNNQTMNKSGNESGIIFFKDQEDIGDSFEVRVQGEGEIKSDLLQFIHCQAMFLEENKEFMNSKALQVNS